jgi:hypothetical protein
MSGDNRIFNKSVSLTLRAAAQVAALSRTETTIVQLKDRIARTIDYLKNIKQTEIDANAAGRLAGKELLKFANDVLRPLRCWIKIGMETVYIETGMK